MTDSKKEKQRQAKKRLIEKMNKKLKELAKKGEQLKKQKAQSKIEDQQQ